jgi:hypothetical protein
MTAKVSGDHRMAMIYTTDELVPEAGNMGNHLDEGISGISVRDGRSSGGPGEV